MHSNKGKKKKALLSTKKNERRYINIFGGFAEDRNICIDLFRRFASTVIKIVYSKIYTNAFISDADIVFFLCLKGLKNDNTNMEKFGLHIFISSSVLSPCRVQAIHNRIKISLWRIQMKRSSERAYRTLYT